MEKIVEKMKDLLKSSGVEYEQVKDNIHQLAFCIAAASFIKKIKC